VRTGGEIAVFVTRRNGGEVLLMHRAPRLGGYWHVVAGGVEAGETAVCASKRELCEETGLEAEVDSSIGVTEYAYALTEEPAERREQYDPSVVEVRVECFLIAAPDGWEPTLNWEHDDHRWCPPSEATGELRWPATAEALEQTLHLAQQRVNATAVLRRCPAALRETT
jgi:dATP pyrophosphohydrolase